MQQLQVSDDIATQLYELAAHNHISVAELVAQLLESYKTEIAKQNELKQFFTRYQTDMKEFRFSREEANER